MSDFNALCAGLRVEAHRKRWGNMAMVTLSYLGSASRVFLTPDEARQLALLLDEASRKADQP